VSQCSHTWHTFTIILSCSLLPASGPAAPPAPAGPAAAAIGFPLLAPRPAVTSAAACDGSRKVCS